MLKFFAALREMIASDIFLGEVALTAIRDRFIPQLRLKLEQTEEWDEAQKLQDLIELWEDYAKPPQAGVWNGIAVKAMFNIFRDEDLAEEGAQEVALYIMEHPRWMDTFDPEDGPKQFIRLWTSVINQTAKFKLRERRKKKEKTIQKQKEDDIDVIEDPSKAQPVGLPEVDTGLMRLINKDLKKFVERKKGGDEVLMDIFQGWADAVWKKKSFERVMPHKEIFPDLMRRYEDTGKSVSKGTLSNRWKALQRLVVEFFEEELGKTVVPELKRKLKMSSDEVILYEAYRRRFAAWVLNPIMRYRAALADFRAAIQV